MRPVSPKATWVCDHRHSESCCEHVVTEETTLLMGAILLGGILVGALAAMMLNRARMRRALHEAELRREPEIATLREQRDGCERQCTELRRLQAQASQERTLLEQRLHESNALAAERKSEVEQLSRQLLDQRGRHDATSRELLTLTGQHAALEASARGEAEAAREKLALLDQAEQRLRESFQNLATQILDAKAERFKEQNAEHLGILLDPLKNQLKEFRETITHTHANEQRERGMLVQEIRTLKDLNQQISQDAVNLTRALKGDTRTQGAWGEMVLERVLEASGLQAGREYDTQESFQVPMDRVNVRMSSCICRKTRTLSSTPNLAVAWERAVAVEGEAERLAAFARSLLSLRRHIEAWPVATTAKFPACARLISCCFRARRGRFYRSGSCGRRTLQLCVERKISLVSPSTLLATLRTVAYLWRIESRNSNAIEIARRAANLHDNFVSLVIELESLGVQLEKAQGAHASVIRRLVEGGKGSVILQVKSLADMGAPARKSLPRNLVESAGAESIEPREEVGDANRADEP